MHRVLFQIGGRNIYSYGVFVSLGFIAAFLVARHRMLEQYKDTEKLYDLILAAIVGGIIGARLFYVIGHWQEFMAEKSSIFRIDLGGLVFYGGLLLGTAFALLVGKLRKMDFYYILDLAGLCVPLGLAIGRIGCFLNGCCYGKPTSLPWGVTFPPQLGLIGARHPTQIYELILDVVLFGFLWWKRDDFARKGTSFFVFLAGYGAIRFFMEFLREHTQPAASLAFQVGSGIIFLAAVLVLLFRYHILPPTRSGNLG
ncbi:MAG: prolipoprotein diacylglyceryl transferase [Actinomycetota bacterium]|nr:prolipoprotein diacylglyceryl transferase [Actinomycetota bacterium]